MATTLAVGGTATFAGLVDAAIIDGVNFKVNGGQGSDGQVLTSTGSGVAWEASSGTTINNNADNRVITGSGTANTLEGESNLVFTGANLGIGTTSPAVPLDIVSNSGGNAVVIRARSADDYAFMIFKNNAGSAVAGQIYNHSGAIKFTTGTSATERLTINTSGKVHIGNTFAADGSYDNLVVGTGAGNEGMTIYGAANGASSIAFADPNDNDVGSIMYDHSNNFMRFNVAAAERMRIVDGGQLRIGTTGIITGSGEMISVLAPSQGMAIKTDDYCTMLWATGGGSTPTYCFFLSGSSSSTHQGSITKNGGGISYGSNSDYRLKENLDYTWDATTRLKQLKPVRFNWIADETNTLIDGFIAHEVQSVVPEAVTGIKDATHTAEEANESIIVDEGDIKAQQMDASKLIPLLVKAMQEQQALIESLTARITALES